MKKVMSVLIAAFLMTGLSPAHAESGYQYWSFWLHNDGWSMAQEGAGTTIPKDGDIQGWRFVSIPTTASMTSDYQPRSTKSFEEICGSIAKEAGSVRVAIVIDFGDLSDTITEHCSTIREGDNSFSVLDGHTVRDNSGMICGIDNLPATGCGEEVDITPIKDKQDKLPYITMGILAILLVLMILARKSNGTDK